MPLTRYKSSRTLISVKLSAATMALTRCWLDAFAADAIANQAKVRLQLYTSGGHDAVVCLPLLKLLRVWHKE